jgi:hypothetical protein
MKNFFKRIFLKIKLMDVVTKVFFFVFIALAIVTGFVAFRTVRNLTSSMTILNLPGAPVLENIINNGDNGNSSAISQSVAVATPQPWDGNSRVTVLLLGLDYDDWRAGQTPHSDTMML